MCHSRFIVLLVLSLCLAAEPGLAASATAPAAGAKAAKTDNAAQTGDADKGKTADAAPDQKTDGGTAEAEAEPPKHDPWEMIWAGQRGMLNDIKETAVRLSGGFSDQAANLTGKVQPYEEEARRLLVLTNTFKNWPNPMEAVSRRITVTVTQLNHVLEPVMLARSEAQGLLERVNYMADSLPEDLHDGRISPEMQSYIRDIGQARLRLAAVLAQYDSALAPSLALLKRLEKTRQDISQQLPILWKDYYLQRPVPYLSPEAWADFGQQMRYSYQGMILRLPVEMPVTPDQWGTAALRFLICLLFTGVISLLLYRRWINQDSRPVGRHIFRVSLPWLCLGLSLLGSSLSATGEFFRLFLALGNLSVILGQVFLAWDLRMLKYPDVEEQPAPFLRLMPLTLCAYALLYLPLTKPLVLVIWMALVIASLVWWRRWRKVSCGSLQLESSVLDGDSIVLWLCLLLTLSGLHIYSMALYLIFVSCSLALELSLGGMALVSNINEHLPKEGARAALARLLVALAAPVVLVAAVVGVLLWVGTLPGGMYLLGEYVFKGVNVGATQFNIVQILLIISVFYLTRTAVAMGSRFLAKLPKQGLQIDATLIPPMQTAFTYAVWAIFGLFVLRALGMELSNLAMVAGGLSVGIGFGMQTIVNNFLSGLILIFSRTLQAGDVVEVGGTTGRVRKISVRATMVETYDNALIYVPNSEFVASRLINWTRNSRTVRREIKLGVAYGSNTALVIKLLLAVANGHENVLKYPTPTVTFNDFGASTLDFLLRFWVKDYDVGVSTASDIRLAIEKQFREHHIEVAFPQLDVHIKAMPPRVKNPQAQSRARAERPARRRLRRPPQVRSAKRAETTAR
ncbi:mechanosensitive ion channel domain-containing protein [uncultured Desulfovibrio sp.]|uniref:mechanosensitive ion channel family protein n=1 Tax=uncultured Desulfovibrio sp. TaxID=167968 RepID=UPI0003A13C9D|nr:mechanosensitive ion channel domain-containing protein [uncultured Desulfovibrio sp.]